MAGQYYEGIGRRKTSTARVRVSSGAGAFIVNGKALDEYFSRLGDSKTILDVLGDAAAAGSVDVSVVVRGGGRTGQTGAVRMGLARALAGMNPSGTTQWRRTAICAVTRVPKSARSRASSVPARRLLTPSVKFSLLRIKPQPNRLRFFLCPDGAVELRHLQWRQHA